MRNHLAEDVLDSNMLNLMIEYVKYHPHEKAQFDGPIQLLRHTCILVDIFKDSRPIKEQSDKRLLDLKMVSDWFQNWKDSAETSHHLMSRETQEDITILLPGFIALCRYCLTNVHVPITPAFINSDIVENVFSQQRGQHHGAGSNPNYLQYAYCTNSITLRQSTISKKSNAVQLSTSNQPRSEALQHSLQVC